MEHPQEGKYSQKSILMISVRADHGGGPRQLYQLVAGLKDEFKFFVACPRNEPYFNALENLLGCDSLIEIPYRRFSFRSLYVISQKINAEKVHTVHSHGKGAGVYSRLLALLNGVKVIHTFHGIHIGGFNRFQRFLYVWLERYLSALSNKLICVSKSELEMAEGLKFGTDDQRVLVENGVFLPPIEKRSEPLPNNPYSILSITRNDYAKGPELLIDIAKILKERELESLFVIQAVGIEDSGKLNELTEQAGVAKLIQWHAPSEDLSPFFKQAHCYLSTSRWEGMPLAVLEAMSYGVPIVASAVVGNKDLVEHGKTGFLYSRKSPKEAVDQILDLSQSEALRTSMGNSAREIVEELFSEKLMIKRTKETYNQLIE